MERKLEMSLNLEVVVAQLALVKTSYQSIEAALDYIYGLDLNGLHKHPFVGETF